MCRKICNGQPRTPVPRARTERSPAWPIWLGWGLVMLISPNAWAGPNPEIVIVPYAPSNLLVPHPSHEHAPITLKAILRHATCDLGYVVQWDVNLNGQFDDESRPVEPVPGTSTVYDIGSTFTVPAVPRDQEISVPVRVVSRCTGERTADGHFPLFVYDWALPLELAALTPEQIDVVNQMAIQELLWWLHRRLMGHAGAGAELTATVSHETGFADHESASSAALIWAMTLNGHHPAYPPASVQWLDTEPLDGFDAVNDARWRSDPYAETLIRTIHGLAERVMFHPVAAMDEDNTCGFNDDATERRCVRIADTTDALGLSLGAPGTYVGGQVLGALSAVLPTLMDVPVQVGPDEIRGMPWPWVVQQLIDYIIEMQIDSGGARGAWSYHSVPNRRGDNTHYGDASTTQWVLVGLAGADLMGDRTGLVVNNLRYRIANHLISNQSLDGGSSYRTASRWSPFVRGSFQLTGGALVGMRSLAVHEMRGAPLDNRPFSNPDLGYDYSRVNIGELLGAYDGYLDFTVTHWASATHVGSVGWVSRLWEQGDYQCGQPQGVLNGPRCGNTYAAFGHKRGFLTGQPEIEQIGGHDWRREMAIYYIRAQNRQIERYDRFGQVVDAYCGRHSVTCHHARATLTSGWAALTLTPSLFNPKPVAVAMARPRQMIAGCAEGHAGVAWLEHGRSFHPRADGEIGTYQWDRDDHDGLWWQTGRPPDFETADPHAHFEAWHERAGVYDATLRVIDRGDASLTDLTRVRITVNQAPRQPPVVQAGGPYWLEVGADLRLDGHVRDPNTACGDRVETDWDLDRDGIGDALGPDPVVPWIRLAGLDRERVLPITLRARDGQDHLTIASTTLTIYPREPVAVPMVSPNPGRSGQTIHFDGSASHHAHPSRTLIQYHWEVAGGPTVEGEAFSFRFERSDRYAGRLVVTDDLGRTAEASFGFEITADNRPPVARPSVVDYEIIEGEGLHLDGRQSNDPDDDTGDRIVEWAWDLDGNGAYDDAVDRHGERVDVPWAALQHLDRVTDPVWGRPKNPATLRVTDTAGAQGTATFTLTVRPRAPVPVIVQHLDPAPVASDGRWWVYVSPDNSHSSRPGVALRRFEWDTNDDGHFDVVRDLPPGSRAGWEVVLGRFPSGREPLPAAFVRLRITDEAGGQATLRQPLRLAPVDRSPPMADADPAWPPEPGYVIFEGDVLLLDGGRSRAFGGRNWLSVFRWHIGPPQAPEQVDFDADRSWEIAGTPRLDLTPALHGLTPGRAMVTLEIEDQRGQISRDTAPLRIYAGQPEARIVATPHPAPCNVPVAFEGRLAQPLHPEMEIESWRWDLDGDGVFDDAAGEQATAAYAQTIPVALQVSAIHPEDGRTTSTTTLDLEVLVDNQPPVPIASASLTVVLGEGLTLDATGSMDPNQACGDRIVAFEWDAQGDGVANWHGARIDLSAEDLAAAGIVQVGDYPITLRVADRFGAVSSLSVHLRVIEGPHAVARANKARVGCNEPVTLDGTDSFTDGAGWGHAIATYAWDLDGDGVYEQPGAVVRVNAVGRELMRARLRVTDNDGRRSEDAVEIPIHVDNRPPQAEAGGPYRAGWIDGVAAPVSLDARGSSDPNAPCDAIVAYGWDTDDDGLYGLDDRDGAGALAGRDHVGPRIDYVNPDWTPHMTQRIGLRVQDRSGAWSPPAMADIWVTAMPRPPEGEILSPRAEPDACIGAGPFEIRFEVSGVTGDDVSVTAQINSVIVGHQVVATPDDGGRVQASMTVEPMDLARVPEGEHRLELILDDGTEPSPILDAGGAILFDRSPPQVTLGARPAEAVCYADGAVPDAEVTVVDRFDAAPTWGEQIVRAGCQEMLTVTARDRCGNESTTERRYRVALSAPVEIHGVAEDSLVSAAQITWDVLADEACHGQITAAVSIDGRRPAPYPEGAWLDTPGHHALTVDIPDCAGRLRQLTRHFAINASPVAVPGGPYHVRQGATLRLDGSGSLAPEARDAVVRWDWDLDEDGIFETAGERVPFDTSTDGLYVVSLRVTDSLGATDVSAVDVIIDDVDPLADAGPDAEIPQGQPLELDGRRSRAGDATEPITRYRWDFGDATEPVEGPDAVSPLHTYAEAGRYVVTLTVFDRESAQTDQAVVEVLDVDPLIDALDIPAEIYEAAPMTLRVRARPGHDNDPIVAYEWHWHDGAEPRVTTGPETTRRFREAGEYRVVLYIHDDDSTLAVDLPLVVREITLAEVIELARQRIAHVEGPPEARAQLDGVDRWLNRALWGEARDRRGNIFVALTPIVDQIVLAQLFGANLGDILWIICRQVAREITRQHAWLIDPQGGGVEPENPYITRAGRFVTRLATRLSDPDFERALRGDIDPMLANDFMATAHEAYFYLTESIAPCNHPRYAGFPVIDDPDALEGTYFDLEAANRTNDQLEEAFTLLAADLGDYLMEGDDPPGRAHVRQALFDLHRIRELLAQRVGIECRENGCISDGDSLNLTLEMAALVVDLFGANHDGVWVRNWQSCLMQGIRFKTELAMRRVTTSCGPHNEWTLRGRQSQDRGLRLIDDLFDIPAALTHYVDRSTQCLMIEIYNECLVPRHLHVNEPRPYPALCEDQRHVSRDH